MAAIRVLLVEDEGLIRMMTAEYLEDDGFEVTEAKDGDEAAILLDGPDRFDVLFADVRMPGSLDGIEVALHARRKFPAMPILLVSGFAAQLMRRLRPLNPQAVFIRKPYHLHEIAEALRLLATST